MLSVCLIVEDKEPEWYNQWSYTLNHWQPDRLFVLGDNEINTAYIAFRNAIAISSVSELPLDHLVVMQPLSGQQVVPTVSLWAFDHPSDGIYMFGADHRVLEASTFSTRSPDSVVYIPTTGDLEMYSWQAGVVTLADRSAQMNRVLNNG